MDINLDVFFQSVRYVATLSTSLFTGGILYYLIAEYPSMMECGPKHAADHWKAMFKRVGPYNMSLATISFLSCFLAYYLRRDRGALFAGLIMVLIFLFSIILVPTYKTLLTAIEEANFERSTSLIKKWSHFHVVRGVFALIALSFLIINF